MHKLNVSISYFTLDGEFLDEQVHAELKSNFGENEAIIAEIKSIESIPEINIDTKKLDKFWEDCRIRPDTTHAFEIAVDEYEVTEYTETFNGVLIAYLNCQYQPKKEAEPIPEPKAEQLQLF